MPHLVPASHLDTTFGDLDYRTAVGLRPGEVQQIAGQPDPRPAPTPPRPRVTVRFAPATETAPARRRPTAKPSPRRRPGRGSPSASADGLMPLTEALTLFERQGW